VIRDGMPTNQVQ
jgi:serine/threonine protein phosphatase PrpC